MQVSDEHVCVSLDCRELATIIVGGVPLCDEHRRKVHADLTLPRPRYATTDGEPWFVYYITWPHMPEVVKIGATKNVAGRLGGLKKEGHFPRVLVIEPGIDNLETARHDQFATLCLSHRGEYFRYCSPLTEHIEELQGSHSDWMDHIGRLPWWMNPKIEAASFKEVLKCATPCAGTGRPCLLAAGSGTAHPGEGQCRLHERANLRNLEVLAAFEGQPE